MRNGLISRPNLMNPINCAHQLIRSDLAEYFKISSMSISKIIHNGLNTK